MWETSAAALGADRLLGSGSPTRIRIPFRSQNRLFPGSGNSRFCDLNRQSAT